MVTICGKNNFRVLSGTAVPNSTFKGRISSDRDVITPIIHEENLQLANSSISLKCIKDKFNAIIEESSLGLLPIEEKRRSSILSGTGTLEELKELSDLLHKSSYIPKQKKTRQSTIEKIKNAIKKEKNEKLEVANKCENTIITIEEEVTVADASTAAIIKKKKKSNKTAISLKADSSGHKKKLTKKNRQANIEIQCSLYKYVK